MLRQRPHILPSPIAAAAFALILALPPTAAAAPATKPEAVAENFSQWLTTFDAKPMIAQYPGIVPPVEARLPGAASGSPSIIQLRNGAPGNFELVSPAQSGGLLHFWRDNDADPERAWHASRAFGQSLGAVDGASLVQSNYGPATLELVATSQGRIVYFAKNGGPESTFRGPLTIGVGGAGTPSMIQGRIGRQGDFELTVPSVNGGISYYWRENDVAGTPWRGPISFGQNLGLIQDVSLIQSNYGNGNLELFARVGSRLYYFWKLPERNQPWQGPYFLFEGAAGNPSFIQSRYGRQGNFELVVPSTSGGIDHYWRNNDSTQLPWAGPYKYFPQLSGSRALSLIQGNFGSPGNLEMVIRSGNRLDYATRDASGWSTNFPLSGPVDLPPFPGPSAALRKAYTEPMGSLVSAPGRGGVNDMGRVGMAGTDLGSSFEWNGLLVFLFGDTWAYNGVGSSLASTGFNDDSLAWTRATQVERNVAPLLTFHTQAGGRFTPLRVAGASHSGMEVPVEGLSIGGIPYVFFVSGFQRLPSGREQYLHSVLAHMDTYKDSLDASSFRPDHIVRSERFLNVSAVQEDGQVYIFGAGNPYRGSSVFLARVAPHEIGNRSLWTYFRGTTQGQPVYGPWESSAADLIRSPCVAEFSVRKHEATGLYLMTYNCTDSNGRRGYHLRTASNLWGPWSQSEIIYDLSVSDGGYGVTQHIETTQKGAIIRADDGVGGQEHFNPDQYGGEYGPYMVPRWFTSQGGAHSIVYAHSSWNPYKTHLMKTVLVSPGVVHPRPIRGAGLPRATIVNAGFSKGTAGWQSRGTPFNTFARKGGEGCVTTFVPAAGGELATGAIWQDIQIDANATRLTFSVHGGNANVRLYHRGERVRETRARNSNDLNVPAHWYIQQYRGETVRLAIEDDATGAWGFVSVCGLQIE